MFLFPNKKTSLNSAWNRFGSNRWSRLVIAGVPCAKYDFLKIIKKGKIKESLFCICDLLYEKYLRKTENDNELKQQKKITILEEKEKYQKVKKVSVNFLKNSIDRRNTKVEIYFIDIEKIIEKNKNKKGWEKYLETNRENILIVGIIKNN